MAAEEKQDETSVNDDAGEWLSLPRAGRAIQKSEKTVLQMALKGELVSKQFGQRTWISQRSIDQYNTRIASDVEAGAR